MRMRRVLRITEAPIFRSFARMVAVDALASSVPVRANALKRCIRVYAKLANSSLSQLARNKWALARVPNKSSWVSLMRFSASPRPQ